jgi:S1-C subfamily serine protease
MDVFGPNEVSDMRPMPLFSKNWIALIGLAMAASAPIVSAYQATNRWYSPRLGIDYELVAYGGAYGARILAPPSPGSPLLQEQIQLEQGDVITHLDQTPISGTAELERHRGQTSVQFIDVRTNTVGVRWAYLPAMNAPPVPRNSSGLVETSAIAGYSPRLGMFYDFVSYGGAYGARLKAPPVAGSPLLQEQLQLEPGDTITHLDGTPITGAPSLEAHHGQTSVQFVNVRTGGVEVRWLFLPSMETPGIPPRFTGRMLPRISDVPPGVPELVPPAAN